MSIGFCHQMQLRYTYNEYANLLNKSRCYYCNDFYKTSKLSLALKTIINYLSQPLEGHESEKIGGIVGGAIITSNGKLTPNFEYIAKLREAQNKATIPGDFSSEKKVINQSLHI